MLRIDKIIRAGGCQQSCPGVPDWSAQGHLVSGSSCLDFNGRGGRPGVEPCEDTFQHMAEFGSPRLLIEDVLAPPDQQRLQISHDLVRPWPKLLRIPSRHDDRCHEFIGRTLSSKHCGNRASGLFEKGPFVHASHSNPRSHR